MGENRFNYESGIHKRIACLIGAVLVVLMCITAAVPVSANEESNFTAQYDYIAQDSFGIIYLSNRPLAFTPFCIGDNFAKYIGITQNEVPYETLTFITVLIPKYISNTLTYEIYNVGWQRTKSVIFDATNYTLNFDYGVNSLHFQDDNVDRSNIFDFVLDYSKFRMHPQNYTFNEYKVTANYQILTKYPNTDLPAKTLNSNQIVYDTDFNLSNAVGESGISEEELSTAINNALNTATDNINDTINDQTSSINGTINSNGSSIVGAIQTQTNTLIAYGNNFIQFIPTDKADTLETKQNALHDAESALDTKSKSLASKASAGLATATASAGQLAANLAQPVAVVSTVITDFTATVPDEVKPVLTAAPLLSFIVWLIGLRR